MRNDLPKSAYKKAGRVILRVFQSDRARRVAFLNELVRDMERAPIKQGRNPRIRVLVERLVRDPSTLNRLSRVKIVSSATS